MPKISTNPYDMVEEIWKTNGDAILFTYDAAGNRVTKELCSRQSQTDEDTFKSFYGRDARGTTLGFYRRFRDGNVYRYKIRDLMLYGQKRLGTFALNRTVNTQYIEELNFLTKLYNIKYNSNISTIWLPWW